MISRRLHQWTLNDRRLSQTRSVLKEPHDRQYYISKSERWSAETMANVVITMIHQCDYLLARLIESQKKRFLEEGGIREAMMRGRREYKSYQSYQSAQDEQRRQASK